VSIGVGVEGYMERETERGVEMRMCMKMEMKVYTSAARLLHHTSQAGKCYIITMNYFHSLFKL
jgi:hypothetical protein